MAKRKTTSGPAGETPAPAPLDRARKVRRAFSSQARCAPALADFTADELEAFAGLIGDDGSFVEGIRERFAATWSAHRQRLRDAAKSAKPPAE